MVYQTIDNEDTDDQPEEVINAAQIRMARAALRWTAATLAREANLGVATVQRAETGREITVANLLAIQRAFEAAGLVFFDAGQSSPRGGAGVRFRQ